MGNAFSLLLIIGILIMVLGQIFLSPLLRLFGASETILPYATEYMRTIFFGSIFQVVSMGMNNFLRADGQPKLAMITMFMGAGVNIVLDPIFIYGFKMGMMGAALATILSQCLSMIWILSYFLGKRANNKLQLKYMKLKPRVMLRITTLGLPGFLMQLSNSLLTAILNRSLMTYGGDIAVSGMGIVNSVQTMLLMPLMGINQGVQPIISFNYGAQKYDRVKTAERLAIIAATAIVLVGWLLTRLFPVQIVSLFNREPELVRFGSKALVSWFWFLPVIGFQVLAANFFQAIGRSTSAMVLTLSRQVVLLIPAIFIFPRLWGMSGLLYAAPFADALSALITGIWFWFGMKHLSNGKLNTGDAIPTIKKIKRRMFMISHVTVRTARLHETVEFYQWFLDRPIAMELQTPVGKIVFLGTNDAKFELIGDEKAEKISARGLTLGVPVDDLDKKLAMLESKGIPHSDIMSPMPQVRFAFFNDLNGCEIQLCEGTV
ncbi:MAG: MATE family efflux transporter [Oscillospiraceae bacterium]|nr:MATE family efflux transporter [Oscillospiraceae bacterium]